LVTSEDFYGHGRSVVGDDGPRSALTRRGVTRVDEQSDAAGF
jgi:hypothetical protein